VSESPATSPVGGCALSVWRWGTARLTIKIAILNPPAREGLVRVTVYMNNGISTSKRPVNTLGAAVWCAGWGRGWVVYELGGGGVAVGKLRRLKDLGLGLSREVVS
jgi:hypothetical protein